MPRFLKNKWLWIGILLIIVLVIGFVVYFAYSRRHSRLGKDGDLYLNPAEPKVVGRDG